MLLHAFSFKEGPRPPLGFAKGGPKIFKGGPNFFFADRSGTWPQRHLAAARLLDAFFPKRSREKT